MNIFVSDLSPIKSAHNLDDKRVFHMSRECYEMITMAIFKNTKEAIGPFIIWGNGRRNESDKFNELFNNKCTNWVANKRENIWWLWRHSIALLDECSYRFNKEHYLYDSFRVISHYIPEASNEPSSFANASGQEFTDIVESYRKCLRIKWFVTDEIQPCIWTRRGKPNWANPIVVDTQIDMFQEELDQEAFDDLPF